ncbi:MAG TPA: ABC transporter substrate-binding protein [Dehalococcoidia bacterium]|nr:ABC transporter substrate-binding protein [Dehalococcoidia bacterium]
MSYWNDFAKDRITRRRALSTTAAGIVASAFLAACGGSDSGKSSSGEKDSSGLLSKPVDTTPKAVPGGIWVKTTSTTQDAVGWDPLIGGRVAAITDSGYVYSRLLKYKTGTPAEPPPGLVEGDAATSWEVSPDGLQVTFKLRQGMQLDARPPTSGRALSAQDIKWSWDRFSALSSARGDMVNSVNPEAPVRSMTAPDSQTIVLNLAFPYAPILKMAGYHFYFSIMPVEAEGKFDAKSEARGTGPWILDKWFPSKSVEYRRNPNFYVKNRPFLDGVSNVVLSDYATGLAQFEQGNLWTYDVSSEDILSVKRRRQELLLMREAIYPPGHGYSITFGAQPQAPFGLFRDQRMRQAVSMLVDRDALLEFNQSPSKFEKEGIPTKTDYHSHISAGTVGWWLDPKGKEIGEGGKNFIYNVDEAKKLIAAAGMTDKAMTMFQTNQTPARVRFGELMTEMLRPGLKLSLKIVDQNTEAVPLYWNIKEFEGMTMQASTAGPDIDNHLASKYTTTGRSTYITQDMPGISELIVQQRKEFDYQKRVSLVKEIQKKLAVYMPSVPYDGAALALSLQQPWLMNSGAILDSGIAHAFNYDTAPHYWYDKTKQKA